ncbi:hypothetical protein BDP27DRAFT_1453131 [Rhodocollybia butyracea]|uniref:Uncharacterized protein n=1 Tax=Rhodocollybia butyracea TaxID=206335 RepID=A0A9P5PCI6_9AGAR|nr:hypothetical protein BDP27DRAFT_1453131 [Rhodocollybia butyracea]
MRSIKRDANGKMTRIVFCNEGPEYFEFLAQYQRNTLLDLYRSLNPGFNILEEDLFVDNVYNPLNKWNSSTDTGTIMHLIQVNNTLGAEVDLGARATVQRKRPDGTLITDSDELIQCSKYGNPNRNSDPTIGAGINAAARNQVMLTIQNPVGLYIDSINWNLIEPPAGHDEDDPSTFWKWTRGRTGNYMRGEFEVPEGKGYVLGDLKVNKKPLEYGGQLADYIRVSITARTSDLQIQPRLCTEAPPPVAQDCACEEPLAMSNWSYALLQEKSLPGLANHSVNRV